MLLALAGGLLACSALTAQTAAVALGAPANSGGAGEVKPEAEDSKAGTAEALPQTPVGRAQFRSQQGSLVTFGNAELKAGQTADEVVAIFGSAKIHGKVRNAAVSIFGNLEVDGEVNDVAVAVFGDVRAGQGARIGNDAVAVLGSVQAEPGARIGGDAVAVGGRVEAAEGATIGKQIQSLPFPKQFTSWLKHCVLWMRPLAPQVGWVWIVAGAFFLLYMLIAAVFPFPVKACVDELALRPATTFLMGLLAKLLVPVLALVLAATGVGVIVVPFIFTAVLLASLVGKAALLECLGFGLVRRFGATGFQRPLMALVVGAIFLALLYMVPVLGLIAFGVTGLWGLGVAVTAGFGSLWRELPKKPAQPGANFSVPASAPLMAAEARADTASAATPASPAQTATATAAGAPPVLPDALCYPKASFWERMAAGFLDVVLVGILGSVAHHFALLVALAYFAGMWTWKGTTVGGIVLGLKVVRVDGQPVSFLVALVRSLAAAFSGVVLLLGFLWIAWDAEHQGWHDKIAGTVVIKLPRGTPLVCL
jgi:uncharacterized RDD family membrane protein YckC